MIILNLDLIKKITYLISVTLSGRILDYETQKQIYALCVFLLPAYLNVLDSFYFVYGIKKVLAFHIVRKIKIF